MNVTWLRSDVLQVGVIAHGARIVAVRTPDLYGRWGDIALGLAGDEAYQHDRDYLGACVGRFANRIAGGRFTLDGTEHQVPQNEPGAALHGGPAAFEHATWDPDESRPGAVTLRRRSPDGENGFPGELQVSVTYAVDGADLRIEDE